MWIGYEDADSLLTYPHADNLSAWAQYCPRVLAAPSVVGGGAALEGAYRRFARVSDL